MLILNSVVVVGIIVLVVLVEVVEVVVGRWDYNTVQFCEIVLVVVIVVIVE